MERTGRLLLAALLLAISAGAAAAQNVSGTGPQVTDLFPLTAGRATFDVEYDGDGSFTVRLLDDKGELVEQLISTTGRSRESRTVEVPRTGQYFYDVSATGSWIIRMRRRTTEERVPDPEAGRW